MDDSQEKKSNMLPIPAMVSLMLASLAVFVQQFAPLESLRPVATDSVSYSYRDIEDVDARLWQDPFAALTRHDTSSFNIETCPNSQAHNHHDVAALGCSIVEFHKRINGQPINVLGVMVFGGPYAENAESRRRTRYAILSGLAVKGFVPENADHIGYFDKPTQLKHLPEKVPFEWFKFRHDGSPVLLLWLDESAFASAPLSATRDLVEFLKAETKNEATQEGWDAPPLTFKFIGPASSDTLQAMVNELVSKDAKNTQNTELPGQNKAIEEATIKPDLKTYLGNKPFEFFNASATGDWPGITNIPGEKNDEIGQSRLRSYLEEIGLSSLLIRTSLFDYQLALAILDELKLRGIDAACEKEAQLSNCYLRGNQDHIVLISEWDTHYGRQGLPDALHKALRATRLDDCLQQKRRREECFELDQRKWVHPFSYMRGLDGVVPGEGKAGDEGKAAKERDSNKNAKEGVERPEGQSQKDYLRRLAVQIGEIERNLESQDAGNIRAIGVLGSDAYDKMMILQALRPMFPKAVFFTTDLDARLMHPKEFDVTRNLIVAASFGLQLEGNLQQNVPPFRDSYQTAAFLATQIALDKTKGNKLDQDEVDKMLGSARLFETGFSKPIDLSKDGGDCKSLRDCNSVHPSPRSVWPNGKFIAAIGFILVSLLLLANSLSERCRALRAEMNRYARECIALDRNLLHQFRKDPERALTRLLPQALLLAVLGITAYEMALGDRGEPFYWSQGVSIWPTELIRLVAGILGCLFIAAAARTMERNQGQLASDFCLVRPPDEQTAVEDDGLREQEGRQRVDVTALWNWYCIKASPSLRNRRVFRNALLFAVFGLSLLYVVGFPNVPYRGQASLLANTLALFFSVSVFVVLVMIVIDATWRSVDLITRLTRHVSVWPENTLRRFGLQQDAGDMTELRDELSKQDKYYLNEWIDIQFIAAHTKETGHLVYYPVILLILMIFARSRIFDNWNMPLGLVLVLLASAGLTLICALYLRRTAESARQAVFRQIDGMLIGLSARPEAAARTLEKQAAIALKHIQDINEGAFMPLVQEPAVQALMLPFGGWGGLALLEHFVLRGF